MEGWRGTEGGGGRAERGWGRHIEHRESGEGQKVLIHTTFRSLTIGWLVCWLACWWVGWLVGRSVGWLVGLSVG